MLRYMQHAKKLRFHNYLGFGLGDFAFNLFFQGATLFLLFFYTDVLEIEATVAGSIFLIATIWDAISDPLMGYLAGKTRSRWGRYRLYLLLAPIPLGISYVIMFYKPDLSGWHLILWAIIWQILFRTFFTLGNIPYSSLSSEMTLDSNERSKLAAYRMFLGYGGALCVSVFTSTMMSAMGWNPNALGYFKVGIIFAIIAAILFYFCFRNTFEIQRSNHQKNPTIGEALNMLKGNIPFLLLAGFIVLGMSGVVIFYQSLSYYFKYNLGQEGALGQGMLYLFVFLMLSLPLWLQLSLRFGKRNTLISGCVIMLLGSLSFYLNPLISEDVFWIYFHMSVIGIGIGCAAFSFWAMLPDTVEFGEWKSGVRAESILFGLGLFFLKIGLGLGSFILGFLLNGIAYVPNTVQSSDTLTGIHQITTLAMALPALGIIILMLPYRLTAKSHQQILEELQKR